MSESLRHKRLCELLYQLLCAAVDGQACVGSDQFVYYDASSPKKKCSPDAFVKLGVPAELFEIWKVWKKGAPELCVEILSPSDTEEKLTLPEKLRRFHTMGVSEVLTFDVDADMGTRIRAWDLVQGDLVGREVLGERTPCLTLGLWFVVAPYEDERHPVNSLPAALRLSRDAEGKELLLTADEQARLEAHHEKARAVRAEAEVEQEKTRAEQEKTRAEQEKTRAVRAEAEVERLRAELARRPT